MTKALQREQDQLAAELRDVRRSLEDIAATLRFLMAVQLVKDGHAADLIEGGRIARDPERLAALYPAPG
jgi:DNA-binding transcriptional regulator YbjK